MDDQKAVAHTDDLRHFGRNDNDGFSAVRQLIDELIDFVFGAHVDSAGGFVQNQHFRVGIQPFSQDDFLLIPPLRFKTRALVPGVLVFSVSTYCAATVLLPAVNKSGAADFLQGGQRGIFTDRALKNQALGLAVFQGEAIL